MYNLCTFVDLNPLTEFLKRINNNIFSYEFLLFVKLKTQKVLRPGFEPGFLRPQRRVLTTRRSQLTATLAAMKEEIEIMHVIED